jgi:hypothetical protein
MSKVSHSVSSLKVNTSCKSSLFANKRQNVTTREGTSLRLQMQRSRGPAPAQRIGLLLLVHDDALQPLLRQLPLIHLHHSVSIRIRSESTAIMKKEHAAAPSLR